MDAVTLIGVDLGKHTFHLHGQDKHGKAVFRKKLSRRQLIEFFATFHTCTVAMEACAGAHHMARMLATFGHRVKLISPQFVRPFVKSNKNDFVDAEAICEAACRPAMRFVTPKTESQQTLSTLHRVRESLVRDRTKAVNQIHGFLLEFGVSLAIGPAAIRRLPKYLDEQIGQLERDITRQLSDDEIGQRLLTIPGVGVITASVLASEMGDGKQYRCGRDFAAAIGLVPRQHSTGGRANLLGISRRGDKNIRRLLVTCARAYMIRLDKKTGRLADWVRAMMTRRHSNVVACALANKLARTAWAIATHHTVFDARSSGVAA